MAEKLYALAVEMAAVGPGRGVGALRGGRAMGQLMARRAKIVWAVEATAPSGTASKPRFERHRQPSGSAKVAASWSSRGGSLPEAPTVVLLDPPAQDANAGPQGRHESRPRRVVYVSCDPGTGPRRGYLSTGGYRLQQTSRSTSSPDGPHQAFPSSK